MKDNTKTTYIGYGIGCNYEAVSAQIKEKLHLSFLCDKKWDSSVTLYDSIPVIRQSEIAKLENVMVIIFPSDIPIKNAIEKEMQGLGVEFVFVEDLLGNRCIKGKEIKAEGSDGVWEDAWGNKIFYHESIPDDLTICLNGVNSQVVLEEGILINGFCICMGNDGFCKVGANTRVVGVTIFAAYASVIIGEDCLFSSNVTIRTHDAHHIFDRNTHERINKPKDVILHNHVWVGEGACLLPGTNIGEGSIVAAKAVTSSTFGDHVIIAGVPAKVIRENVCWSKDSTECINYSYAEESISGDALKYC